MFKCEFCKYESKRKANLIRHQLKKNNCNKSLSIDEPVISEPVIDEPVKEQIDEIINNLIENDILLPEKYHDRPELHDEPFMMTEFANAMLFLENRYSIKHKSSKAYMLMTECRKRFGLNKQNQKKRHRSKSKKVKNQHNLIKL
jgi:hypothetical protein